MIAEDFGPEMGTRSSAIMKTVLEFVTGVISGTDEIVQGPGNSGA
jgi:hypothetical protein